MGCTILLACKMGFLLVKWDGWMDMAIGSPLGPQMGLKWQFWGYLPDKMAISKWGFLQGKMAISMVKWVQKLCKMGCLLVKWDGFVHWEPIGVKMAKWSIFLIF